MNRFAVTGHLRKILLEEFPKVFTKDSLTRLLYYVLFPSRVDEDTGLPVLPTYLLANLEDKVKLFRGHRYKGGGFLEEFKEAVDGRVEYTEYVYKKGRARTASLTMSEELARMVEEEMCRPTGGKLIDLVTGEKIPQRDIEQFRRVMRMERRNFPQSTTSPARDYAQWLNTTDVRAFDRVRRNLEVAIEEARSIQDPVKRRANLGTLFRMGHLDWVPTYKTTDNTPRIYTEGSSAAGLSSNVRTVLLGGGKATFSADLVAAQLAILAHIWKLDRTATLVSKRGQVWPTLLAEAALSEVDKGELKTFVYSTAFGMADHALKYKALKSFGAAKADRLLESPTIQELLSGRRQRQEEIRRDGGFFDVFGNFRSLDEVMSRKRPGGNTPTQEEALRMSMAYEAQAYEFRLMQPVLDIAMATQEVRVLFWLHDGVYFSITQPERVDLYRGRIERAVKKRAQELGMHTELDIEQI